MKVVQVEWFGDQAVKVTFEGPDGTVRNRLVYRSNEASLELMVSGRAWQTDLKEEMTESLKEYDPVGTTRSPLEAYKQMCP